MSERTNLKNLDAPAEQGSSELSALRASKDLGSKPANLDGTHSPDADLSQSSITTPAIERISALTDKRIIRQGLVTASHTESESPMRGSAKSTGKGDVGIFKNPYYPYRGNVLDRFVALIANICKVLERLFLKLLGGGDVALPKPAQRQPAPQTKQGRPSEEASKKRATEEKLQRQLGTHRS